MYLFQVLLLTISLHFFPSPPAEISWDKKEYCNARFDFCVQYPANLLSEQYKATNGDGAKWSNEDQSIQLSVAGSHNVEGWDIEAINQFYFDQLIRKDTSVHLIAIHTDDTYGWVKMRFADKVQYFSVRLLENSYVTTLITVAKDAPKRLDEVRARLDISFPV